MKAEDKQNLAPLLLMTVRQLEAAMQDAAAEAELLSRAVASLGERGATMRDTGGASTHAKALPILADAQRAMRALQFHDRLSQRLVHVRDALAHLHGCLEAGADGDVTDWRSVRESIRALYTMQDERRLFDAVMTPSQHRDDERDESHSAGVELF